MHGLAKYQKAVKKIWFFTIRWNMKRKKSLQENTLVKRLKRYKYLIEIQLVQCFLSSFFQIEQFQLKQKTKVKQAREVSIKGAREPRISMPESSESEESSEEMTHEQYRKTDILEIGEVDEDGNTATAADNQVRRKSSHRRKVVNQF